MDQQRFPVPGGDIAAMLVLPLDQCFTYMRSIGDSYEYHYRFFEISDRHPG